MKGFGLFLAIVGVIALIAVIIVSVSRWYNFNNEIGDYLKLAGDAPTIEKADKFLGTALDNIERRGLTSGNSAFIFHKPNANVGIWYGQIQGARKMASAILEKTNRDPSAVSQLEQTNILMKIRETVIDNSSAGIKVTTPPNITWFPNQWGMFIWWILSFFSIIIGCVLLWLSVMTY